MLPKELENENVVIKREAAIEAKFKPKQNPKKIPKWKLEHEQFIAVLKANKGGAVIQSNPMLDDRIECPTCGRKFNETAAERHIPKCGSIMNKPSFLKKGNGLAGGNLGASASPVKSSIRTSMRGGAMGKSNISNTTNVRHR